MISKIASVLFHFFPTSSTEILLESQWGCPQVFCPQAMGKKQQALLGPRLLLAVDEWRFSHCLFLHWWVFMLPSWQCPQPCSFSEASATYWVEVWQFTHISSGPWQATALLEDQDDVHPCAQRETERGLKTLSLCAWKVRGRDGSSLSSFYRARWVPVWLLACNFIPSAFFSLFSFSLCSAKIVSVTHLYPPGKVTCGQCCKTPGGSCGCLTEMTYVQVTKYTQKLWRRKVWFQRILFHDSWEKWETRFIAPHGSSHGTELLTVSSKNPYVMWRTPCLCLPLVDMDIVLYLGED